MERLRLKTTAYHSAVEVEDALKYLIQSSKILPDLMGYSRVLGGCVMLRAATSNQAVA